MSVISGRTDKSAPCPLYPQYGRWAGQMELKAGNFYQASIYAWNAFREGKNITTVKFDTKGWLHSA